MKRFLVFAYDCYYPMGGLSDMVGNFDTEAEARECAEVHKRYDYVELIDFSTGKDLLAVQTIEAIAIPESQKALSA